MFMCYEFQLLDKTNSSNNGGNKLALPWDLRSILKLLNTIVWQWTGKECNVSILPGSSYTINICVSPALNKSGSISMGDIKFFYKGNLKALITKGKTVNGRFVKWFPIIFLTFKIFIVCPISSYLCKTHQC